MRQCANVPIEDVNNGRVRLVKYYLLELFAKEHKI
jgi:hypothetical protein